MQDPKNRQKFAIWAPSHNFVWLYLRNWGTYRQSQKLVKQQCLPCLPHVSSEYGELRITSDWDLLASLGHPSKFQPVARLGSITARHSSSERQRGVEQRAPPIFGRAAITLALAHVSS